jgi:hypothetical protein
MSKYPNDTNSSFNRRSAMRAHWQCWYAQSHRPSILVVYMVVQSYHTVFITFFTFLKKISEVIGPTLKISANVNIWFDDQRIDNWPRFVEPIDGGWLYSIRYVARIDTSCLWLGFSATVVTGHVLDDWRSLPSRVRVILFPTTSRPALGPVQWLLRGLFPSVNRRVMKLSTQHTV